MRRRTGHSCGDAYLEFDHREVGTPGTYWSPLLADLPRIDPCAVPGPVVVVSPHPDDEVLAAGGTVQRLVLAGAAVTVLSLTDGEAADPDVPSLGASAAPSSSRLSTAWVWPAAGSGWAS